LIGVKTKLKMGHVNGLGAFDNKIEITSSGIFLDGVVGGVRLGYATGNSYLGDAEVSTQLIATRGYTALKIARRITTTTIVSSTVMADDSVMNLTLDANARYQIEAHIAYWSTAASQKLLVSWSSDELTTYASRECIGLSTDSTGVRGLSVFQRLNIGDIGRYGAPTAGGGTAALSEKMLVAVSSNGATLNIRFAQKVSSTTPMTISGNSYISARRVTT
jgi:hypothetical protein